MAKSAPKLPHIKINLLYPQGLSLKIPVRFIKWLIAYGRFIVIPVEILVVATFIFRFKLDADLANIKDQINSQVPFIESLAFDEALIRQTQFKLSTIKELSTKNPNWVVVSNKLTSLIPKSVIFTGLVFDNAGNPPTFRFTGSSRSNNDIGAFINGLKNSDNFSNINLANLSQEGAEINFVITGELKPK